jgi:hypothetical protein
VYELEEQRRNTYHADGSENGRGGVSNRGNLNSIIKKHRWLNEVRKRLSMPLSSRCA